MTSLKKELTRLQNSNDDLEKKCMDLQSSNVVLSAEAGKLASEIIDLRELLKEQEKKYADILAEKAMLEARPAYAHRANHDSLYEIQPEQKEIEGAQMCRLKVPKLLCQHSQRGQQASEERATATCMHLEVISTIGQLHILAL